MDEPNDLISQPQVNMNMLGQFVIVRMQLK